MQCNQSTSSPVNSVLPKYFPVYHSSINSASTVELYYTVYVMCHSVLAVAVQRERSRGGRQNIPPSCGVQGSAPAGLRSRRPEVPGQACPATQRGRSAGVLEEEARTEGTALAAKMAGKNGGKKCALFADGGYGVGGKNWEEKQMAGKKCALFAD